MDIFILYFKADKVLKAKDVSITTRIVTSRGVS